MGKAIQSRAEVHTCPKTTQNTDTYSQFMSTLTDLKRHRGIAVQKYNVTEQTNKTRHSTIAIRQNLISDDFSLDLFLVANHADIPIYMENLLML